MFFLQSPSDCHTLATHQPGHHMITSLGAVLWMLESQVAGLVRLVMISWATAELWTPRKSPASQLFLPSSIQHLPCSDLAHYTAPVPQFLPLGLKTSALAEVQLPCSGLYQLYASLSTLPQLPQSWASAGISQFFKSHDSFMTLIHYLSSHSHPLCFLCSLKLLIITWTRF